MYNIDINYKFSPIINLLIVVLSFVFVFAPIDNVSSVLYSNIFHHIFLDGLIYYKFFSLFEILVIVLILILLNKYGSVYRKAPSLLRFIFIMILIDFVSKMINPNNNTINPVLGMPLFSDISHYTFILFAYFALFIKKNAFLLFAKKLFYYAGVILVIKVSILFVLFLMGRGSSMFGVNSTSNDSDLLIYIAFYQIAFFVLYLTSKRKIYLLLWLFYLIFLIFSFRRSALAIGFTANVLAYFFIFLREKSVFSKIPIIIVFYGLFFLISNLDGLNIPFKYSQYIFRFTSAIPGMKGDKSGLFNDSGHLEQTTFTFTNVIKDLSFWGTGYGKSNKGFLEGQSEGGIHNVYAATLFYYGIISLAFYIVIILILFYSVLKLILFEFNVNRKYFILKLSAIIFLIMYFAVISASTLPALESIKMEIFWFTITAFVIRIENKDANQIFE